MYPNQTQDPAARNLAHGAMNIGMGGGNLAGAGALSNAIQKPRLQQQLDQLDKILCCCHEAAAGLDACADKVLGPTPKAETAGSAPTPPQSTVEGRLALAVGYAEHLLHRLNETGSRLNQAV